MSSKLPWSISLSVSEPRSSTESIDLVFTGAIVDKPLVRRRLKKKKELLIPCSVSLNPSFPDFRQDFLWKSGSNFHCHFAMLCICSANQWTGVYMIGTFVMKELKKCCVSFQERKREAFIKLFKHISGQCFYFIPPENIKNQRFWGVFRRHK